LVRSDSPMAAPARHLDTQINFLRQLPEHPAGPILVPDPPPVEPGEREDVRRLREGLEIAVRSKVMSATELIRALAKQRRDDLLPTTLEPLDALLGGGLPRGAPRPTPRRRPPARKNRRALSPPLRRTLLDRPLRPRRRHQRR